MKKMYLALFAMALLLVNTVSLNAQNSIEIDGASKPAVSVEFKADDSDVKDALEDYFEKMGNKWKNKGGLYSTEKIVLSQLSTDKLDLFFKIKSKGRRSNEKTTVSMAAKPTVDLFIGDVIAEDMSVRMNAFVKTIPDIVAEYVKQKEIGKLTKDAAEDEADRKKAEKKAAKLTKAAEKSKKKLEEAKN